MAKRTQYYCPFLTPSALPPLLSREFPRTPAGGRWRPPCQRGLAALADWGIPTGCACPPIPGQPPHAKRGGLPPSLAPLVRDPFTAVRRGRACPARSLAITTPFILCIVGRGLDPSGGVGDAAPYNNPQGFSLPQTSAAAWGQAALHPTLPHSVGRAFARNSFTPPCRGRACPALHLAITTPFILCIVGRGLDRLTAHNERRQLAKLARSCGCLPCRGKHCSLPDFAPLNRGPTLTTPHLHGRRGRRPLQNNPQGFSLPQTSAAAWGQAALHPTLPYSVGRAFARNSFTPPCRGRACPARNPAITTPYPLHRRAASHRAFA